MTAHSLTVPVAAVLAAAASLLPITGCDLLKSESDANETELVYPMYVDANENGVNDYVEEPGGRGHGGPHAGSGRMGEMNESVR